MFSFVSDFSQHTRDRLCSFPIQCSSFLIGISLCWPTNVCRSLSRYISDIFSEDICMFRQVSCSDRLSGPAKRATLFRWIYLACSVVQQVAVALRWSFSLLRPLSTLIRSLPLSTIRRVRSFLCREKENILYYFFPLLVLYFENKIVLWNKSEDKREFAWLKLHRSGIISLVFWPLWWT